MFVEPLILSQVVIAAMLISGALLLGVIIEKVVFTRLKKIMAASKWAFDEIIITPLHGKGILWSLLSGFYATILHNQIQIPSALFVLLQKSLLTVFLFSVTIVAAEMAAGLVRLYAKRSEGLFPSISIFTNLTYIIVFITGILIILQSLGISITPVLTALGVGGIAVALAMQDTLSNLFSGLQILASRQIKPGDYVKLSSGEEGHILDITWRNTFIKALSGNMIIVPNAQLASTIITNYMLPETDMGFSVTARVSYNSDLDKVEQIAVNVAQEVLRNVPGGVTDFAPVVRFHTFNDSSINFDVILRCRSFTDQSMLKHEFIKRLHRCFAQEGIEIPFPVHTIYLKSETPAT